MAAFDLADPLNPSLPRRSGLEDQRERGEDVAEWSQHVEDVGDVLLRDQQIDVFGRPRRVMDRDCNSSADRVTNASMPQSGSDRVELGNEVHETQA